MKNVKFWLITVFSDRPNDILGNVSAVVQLDDEIENEKMQLIANDLNQPATTFIWEKDDTWNIRWFAPDAEIPLCGHGTMAAVALFHSLGKSIPTIRYASGQVSGFTENDKIFSALNKGSFNVSPTPEGLEEALGVEIIEHYASSDKNIVVLKSEKELQEMQPNFDALRKLKPFGYAITAKGDSVDFVSRTLVPKVQQLEDHATGSSHTVLVPFWSERLKKNKLSSQQLSRRGGKFECILDSDKVVLGGEYEIIGEGIVKV
ncbi:MAG: phenazine biosynthesis PhzC/PhzF protein [Fluviicola sp.]|nr:MAG: phenazine biosynthesis PhzC/PhzF protein [Fluviicola sp.]